MHRPTDLPGSIDSTDMGNHLLPNNLASFAFSLVTVANWVQYVQKE